MTAGWGINKPGGTKQFDIRFRNYSIKFFPEGKLDQYLHYLPVPTIDNDECNSTKHYNGFIKGNKICAGYTDSEKAPCHVRHDKVFENFEIKTFFYFFFRTTKERH